MRKYKFGDPLQTDAVISDIPLSADMPAPFSVEERDGRTVFTYRMEKDAAVYGLGEQARGIDKRGWKYESYNTEDVAITEERTALYGAHNFFAVDGEKPFGAFFDTAEKIFFDFGYTSPDLLTVSARNTYVYIIEGESVYEVVRAFRAAIGESYIPPLWAFGFGQSRWGYKSEEDILSVYGEYRKADMPLDAIYLDIDYMENFKDFTVDKTRYPDLAGLAARMKEAGVHLVPIIDAAVKAEEGYAVYDEGKEKGYFCTDGKGKPYLVGVWPGESVLPDFLQKEAREWFGSRYRVLLDMGIDGFWNDMNEPATFYSAEGWQRARAAAAAAGDRLDADAFWAVANAWGGLKNSEADHARFYHAAEGGKVVHARAHNLYGYLMARSAAEYFRKYDPTRRFLLFSRSSYIGMHRYAGIWTGDNASWWSQLRHNLTVMPGLNMCGFLFAGADIGGFNGDVTEELLLRWLALGLFFPLFRNHSCLGTRDQECYRFADREAFRFLLKTRYRLLPYLYSEFVRCAREGDMFVKPLSFDYPKDGDARVEDQLFVGDAIMIAPVLEEHAKGRYVYLPGDMKLIRMNKEGTFQSLMKKGKYYIKVGLGEVVFFLRKGKAIPLGRAANNTAEGFGEITLLKYSSSPASVRIAHECAGSAEIGFEEIET